MSAQPQDGTGMGTPASIQDRRPKPQGVLPRQAQMWLMVGLAVVILLIILVTGHSAPAARAASSVPMTAPALAPAERIRSFQQQLAADEARQQQLMAQQAAIDRANVGTARAPDG